ncbi:MAG: hypothetical protein ACXWDL_03820 [Nocardioides sp.]
MININTLMRAQTPSGSALPMSAATFGNGGSATEARVCPASTYVVRDRHVAGIALAQVSRPGSTAWSPPIC